MVTVPPNAVRPIADKEPYAKFRLVTLQMTAARLLEMDGQSLERALQAHELTEICDEEEPNTG